jgi:hypothetical protein
MILEFIAFGWVLNLIFFIINFMLVTTNTLRIKHPADALFRVEALGRLIEHRRTVRNTILQSVIVPFSYSYWFFVFQISYWSYEGDYIDKLTNYYTYN